MEDEYVEILITVDTGFVGAEHEVEIQVSKALWPETEAEQDEYLADELQEAINNNVQVYWTRVDGDVEDDE